MQAIAKPQHNVDEMLSHMPNNQKKTNGYMLMTILQIVDICDWPAKKGGDKYASPEVQNEILTLKSQAILHVIAMQLQQVEFFETMTGECVDSANKGQLVICFRHVDENVDVHEEFVGLYECLNIIIS